MNREMFYEIFDQLDTDQSKIDFMKYCKAMEYPFHLEPQPDAMMQRFYNGYDSSVDEIAQIFVDCFGNQIICYEASKEFNRNLTIIDCLEIDANNNYYNLFEIYRIKNICYTLYSIGARKANELDPAIFYTVEAIDMLLNIPTFNYESDIELDDSPTDSGLDINIYEQIINLNLNLIDDIDMTTY